MCKIQIIIFLVCFLLLTLSVAFAQQEKPLTNADVVTMVKAGLPESTIVLAIQQSAVNFDTSPAALIELKNQGATTKTLDAILQAQNKGVSKPTPTVTPSIKVPMPKVDLKFVTFEVLQCKLFGKRLTCEILITNSDRDKTLRIYGNVPYPPPPSTRIVDASGNEFKVENVQFGSNKGDYGASTVLATGVPIKAILVFENVPSDTSKINLLEISCSENDDNGYPEELKAQLRNAPVTITTPVAKENTLRVFEREFSFEFTSCKRTENSVSCLISVKNNGSESKQLRLMSDCSNGRSRLIDEIGNEYSAVGASIGNTTTTASRYPCAAAGEFAPGATITSAVKFDNVDHNTRLIKLLRLRMNIINGNQLMEFDVDFRDISLSEIK